MAKRRQIRAQLAGAILAALLVPFCVNSQPITREIINRAEVQFALPPGQSNSFTSPPVSTLVQFIPPPTIHFYQNSSFTSTVAVSRVGIPLYIQCEAFGCNRNPNVIETNVIVVTSVRTGDREVFRARETAPDSGRFRIHPPVQTREAPATPGNGVVETTWNDRLRAETDGCDSGNAVAFLLIDPGGVVFDSRSNEPVPGARVTLLDATTDSPAVVFESDGQTQADSTVRTDASGRYTFPTVASGIYRLSVLPPPGYTAPSTVAVRDLPRGRAVLDPGSYGGNFTLTSASAVQVDIPVDPVSAAGAALFVQKIASRQTAEIGDFIDYSVRVKNVTSNILSSVAVSDSLPFGFSYVTGSARLDNTRLGDPAGGAGPQLHFKVGPIAPDETISLTYRVRVGPGAQQGDAVNYAHAVSDGPPRLVSNTAQARVHVGGGVFTDKGIIFGKVFVDSNADLIQDFGEPGVPGIRILVEDGTYAITDSEGKYSIYGLRPLTHAVKVDASTLPSGAQLVRLSNRHSDNGSMQFAELKRGEFHRADFAIRANAVLLDEVKERRKKAEATAETDATLKAQLTPDGIPLSRGDPKGLPASGVIASAINGGPSASTLPALKSAKSPSGTNSVSALPYQALLQKDTLNSENSNLPPRPVSPIPEIPFETGLTNLDNSLAFIDLRDGDTLPMAQSTIRVKGPGGVLTLRVNEQDVPSSRVGRQLSVPLKQMEVVEFVGVPFKPGTNQLELLLSDPFGNIRKRQSIRVIAPDKLAQIKLTLPNKEHFADGKTAVTVLLRLEDAKGVLVTARTPVTLEASLGEWKVRDLDASEPGIQVFVEGGKGEYLLSPPLEPGDCRIHANSGMLTGRALVAFLPDLRPLVAAGIIEGRISFNSLKSGSILPARSRDGFEEELRSFATSGNSGQVNSAGRAAFFLKGKIKGEYLLTAGFDSERDTKERLFRDIQPDEFYPVYGDSSVKGYDAQSTGRLYVRVDKKKCYLLYGDYLTSSQTEARSLGNYSRSLTGIKEHYEKGRIVANAWASHDSSRQVIEELPANGTSGPYTFRTANGIQNSEKVEILTRDRNQPSLILDTVVMSRFIDYEFEPFTGRILFKAPVPSLDANINPISIRVTYEVEQGGDKFWVYGADAQGKVAPWLEVGGAAVRDENPLGAYGLYSANTTVKVGPKTYVMGEVARSDAEFVGDGNAGRVELRHQDSKTEARVYWGRAENTFSNTASILSSGRTEGGARVSYRLTPDTRLVSQALYTESLANDGERKGVRVDVERTFANQVRVEVGARYSTETANPASATTVGVTPNEVTSVRTKVTTPVPHVKGASVYGEYENDVVEPDKRLAAVGGEYQLRPKTRLYARHEFINALGGPFELNTIQQQHTTLIGLDTAYMKDGSLFNEYRMRDAISGREAEAATGLRNLWNVAEGVRLNTTFERVSPIDGNSQNEATAATGAIEYTRNPNWKGTARLELRTSNPNDSLLNTLGYAHKLNHDWTFLGRSIVYLVDNKGPDVGDKTQARFQAGMAWRQTTTNAWNGLAKYEYKVEHDGSMPELELDRQVHMLLFDLNYQPAPRWIISAHYGGKLAFEESNGLNDVADGHLLSLRLTYDITRKWDVGLCTSVLLSSIHPSFHFGVGPEFGYRIRDSVRIACGYNFFGFRDRDLSSEQYTDHGVYFALRLMFDETLMGLRGGEGQP